MKSIKPLGYIKEMLEIQANGLSGNLHKFWPDIKDSKWIGGNAEGWERVPYWLDGFIPLAYLLDNQEMKDVAKFYIDNIIQRQSPDGWICPCEQEQRGRYDMWACFLILKVLVVYYDATGDERIYDVVYKALKNLNSHIDVFTLFDWAQTRWYECLIPIYWLASRCDEQWLFDLIIKLRHQGFDFYSFFQDWIYLEKTPRGKWSQMSHVVNNAMMLKADALYSLYNKNPDFKEHAEYMYKKLMEYHGTVVGTFTGDECLAGKSPVQGTELCAVAELMYSFEHLISITGNPIWADRLDEVTFNAFFGTMSADMWTHQYVQQVNQVMCVKTDNPVYTTNNGESNLFGLEPNYGCCTSNFSQALPKYVLSSFMEGENKIAVINLSPAELNTTINNKDINIRVTGEYPFGDNVKIEIKTQKDFILLIRIPQWAESKITFNGQLLQAKKGFNKIEIKNDSVIDIDLNSQVQFVNREDDKVAIKKGALVYSLKIKEKWTQVNQDIPGREFPHCDYELYPESDWQYALTSKETKFEKTSISKNPFDPRYNPVRIFAKGVKYDWEVKDGCAYPKGQNIGDQEQWLEFIPYATARLRLTELPFVKNNKG